MDYQDANTARLAAYIVRSATVQAANPCDWQWRVERGRRYQRWLRSYVRGGAVVQLDAVRARRGCK